MSKRTLDFYLRLNYDLIIRRIDRHDAPYYHVSARELDPRTFYGVGDTIDEAVASFEDVKDSLFPYYLENGLDIPEPEPEQEELPSGRLLVRIAPVTHMQLIKGAKNSRQSLNSFIKSILERSCTRRGVLAEVERDIERAIEEAFEKFVGRSKDRPNYITDISGLVHVPHTWKKERVA